MATTHGDEQRGEQRHPLSVRVHVQAQGQPETLLISHDWTNHSVFLRTHEPLPLGTVASLGIVIPHHPKPVVIKGVVSRSVISKDNSATHPPGMALTFRSSPPELCTFLEDLVESKLLTHTATEVRVLPSILVAAEDLAARLPVVHTLEQAGYDVAEVDSAEGARRVFDHGFEPNAVVVLGNMSQTMLTELIGKMTAFDSSPDAAFSVEHGAPLSQQPGLPVFFLPPDTPVQKVRELVAGYMPRQSVWLTPEQ